MYALIPRPRARADRPRPQRPIERIVAFARLPSPTFDYFLAGRLAGAGMPPAKLVDLGETRLDALDPRGAFVIFCRYASRASLRWIENNSQHLAGVGLFIDDDLAAWISGAGVPLGYRLFLIRHGVLPLRRLNRQLDRVWAASPALARSLGDERVVVLPPAPRIEDFAANHRRAPQEPTRIVFLAEYHALEHRFLLPVIEKIVRARPQVRVEVTHSPRYSSEWRKLPGVTVSPFRPWPEFRAYTAENPADIALVPLLPDRINQARSPTKRIDIARLGAAGVFSRSSIFDDNAGPQELFLPNEPEAWVDGIVRLIDDPELRARVSRSTQEVVERLSKNAGNFPGLDASLNREKMSR